MRRLGELEAEVLDRLWRWQRPATVRELVDDINNTMGRSLAYTTILTVADVLYRKGWLRRGKVGRAWLYEPVRSREDYTASLMEDALGGTPDRSAALLRFVEHMSTEDVQALDVALQAVKQPRQQRAASGDAVSTDGLHG